MLRSSRFQWCVELYLTTTFLHKRSLLSHVHINIQKRYEKFFNGSKISSQFKYSKVHQNLPVFVTVA